MSDGRSTAAVFRRLQTITNIHQTVGSLLIGPGTTEETFIQSARSYLSDQSDIRTRSLDNADWTEIYQYFKSFRDEEDRDPVEREIRKKAAQELIEAMKTANRVTQPGLWYAATLLDPSLHHFSYDD
jgi:hypothetical protein